jgi:hypothetical protein
VHLCFVCEFAALTIVTDATFSTVMCHMAGVTVHNIEDRNDIHPVRQGCRKGASNMSQDAVLRVFWQGSLVACY